MEKEMDREEELLQMHLLREESPNLHKFLLESLRAKRYSDFIRLTNCAYQKQQPSIDINYVFPHPLDKTLLDIACSEGLEEFVELLLKLGAKPNKVNVAHNRAPIHFATEAGHSTVLKILLQWSTINPNVEAGRQTALHIAVRKNDLKCADILLEGNASPNIPNSKGITAIHMAAMSNQEDMVNLILTKAKFMPDIDSFKDYKKQTTRDVLQQKLPHIQLPPVCERKVDVNVLRYYLEANDETNFMKNLENIDGMLKDNGELIAIATDHNLCEAVKQLITREQEGNITKDLIVAAEIAVKRGHYEILKELVDSGAEIGDKLLIIACRELEMPGRDDPNCYSNRMRCLKLLLSQPSVNVRCEDDKGNTPLHYAARAESSEAVNLLLRAGSYIGHTNILGVPPLAHISPETLLQFLNDSLQSSEVRTDEYEIEFNYRCLMPHTLVLNDDKEHLLSHDLNSKSKTNIEMEPLRYIANNSTLKHLLKHPILSSFLYLKWYRIRYILYVNFIFYVIFYALLNTYILCMTYDRAESAGQIEMQQNVSKNFNVTNSVLADWQRSNTLWRLTAIALIFLAIREMLQLASSPYHYISSFENWLEVALIFLGFTLLGNTSPQVGAVAILFSAWEVVILIGQHPRMSTGIEMFKTVSFNFMRFLFLYALLILAFALAFFTLFKDGENENFPDPGHSLFKTIIMLTGEFDADDIPFVSYPILSHFIFVLFVFLIAIVLFNLLNGLAVSDTASILEKAELVGLISRTKLVAYTESIILGSPLFSNSQCCCYKCCHCFDRSWRLNPFPFLAKKIFFFPKYLPKGKLSVKPYKRNEIRLHGRDLSNRNCSALTMDPQIAARAKEILSRRGHVSENDKIITELELIFKKLEKLETSLEHMKLAVENNNFNPNEREN